MNGHIGELDKLVPHLITEHKIYGRDRLTPRTVSAEDGVIKKQNNPDDNMMQYYWWDSETQSNWKDGYCRSAYLLDNKECRKKRAIYVWNLSIRKMMMAILEFMIHH